MLKQEVSNNHVIWFDDNLIDEPNESIFESSHWQEQGKVIGSATGRGTTWFIQTQTLPAALRHYRRGGLFGKLVEDSYLFSSWEKTRSYQEFELLTHLIDLGVHVPRPIAAQAKKTGLVYRADLLSEKIPEAEDLVAILASKTLEPRVYQAIGREIAKMHQAQVNHTDLNIHNILLDSANKVWIIDFDKCERRADEGWKESNLQRLKRSFVKEQKKRQIHWQDADFEALITGYNEFMAPMTAK